MLRRKNADCDPVSSVTVQKLWFDLNAACFEKVVDVLGEVFSVEKAKLPGAEMILDEIGQRICCRDLCTQRFSRPLGLHAAQDLSRRRFGNVVVEMGCIRMAEKLSQRIHAAKRVGPEKRHREEPAQLVLPQVIASSMVVQWHFDVIEEVVQAVPECFPSCPSEGDSARCWISGKRMLTVNKACIKKGPLEALNQANGSNGNRGNRSGKHLPIPHHPRFRIVKQ